MTTPTLKYSLIAIFTCLMVGCGGGADDRAQEYWEALIKGDEETIDGMIEGAAFMELSRWVEMAPGSSVSIGDVEAEGDTAKVATVLTWIDEDGDETVVDLQTSMVKVNDEWKVVAGATRQAFISSVYRASLNQIGKALDANVEAFAELGDELADDMAEDMQDLTESLQKYTDETSDDINSFLDELDDETREQFEKLLQ